MRPFCSVKRPLQNGIVAAGGRKMHINPTVPRIISTGIMRFMAAKGVFPAKFETKNPSTTLYVNVNIKMIKKWKIKMYICQELFLSLCFHKGPFLFQTV